ncbi:MAG: hypothetical protein ACXVRJ_15535 [Gaiellaceae bacterium]
MTAVTVETGRARGDRRGYQREVERQLEQIRRQVVDLRQLKVAGVRGAAFSERKERLEQTRRRLASLISAGTRTAHTV